MAGNLTKQLNFSVDESTYNTVLAICRKHKIPQVDLCRGIMEAVCQFYRAHEFFTFPVRIEPEDFQRKWLAAEGKQGEEPELTPEEIARAKLRRLDAAAGQPKGGKTGDKKPVR